jgi:hypothetical protein
MTDYQVFFRSDAETACTHITADTPQQALSLAQALYANDPSSLWFEPFDGMNVNEIVVCDFWGADVAAWRDDELKLRLAAQDMFEALQQAVTALNTAPRFKVPGYKDSYRIAAVCDRAIAKAKDGWPDY